MDSSSIGRAGATQAGRRRRLVARLLTSGAAALLLAACGAGSGQIAAPETSSTSVPSVREEAPTPRATPTASPTWSVDRAACGSPVDAPPTEGLWVGDYGGGIGVPVGAVLSAPLEVPLSVILTQDLGGQQLTVTPVQAYLVSTVEEAGVGTSGTVVAVVGAPLPEAVSTLMGPGSEGGGGGSEGRVVLPLTFAGCTEALAPGWHEVVVEVEVSGGGPTMTTWGRVPVHVEG